MAVPANTYQTFQVIGEFEDLEDEAYNIDPTETPLMTLIGRSKASNVFHEWLTDALDAPSATNSNVEGDDATNDAVTPAVRLGNYCQIPDKVLQLSGTTIAAKAAGDVSSPGYLLSNKMKELKLDIDSQISQNKASSAGTASTARISASFESWITTNDSRGGGAGAEGGFSAGIVAAPTDGTQRAFTEALLKAVLALGYESGANFKYMLLGSFNKQVFSSFTGGATKNVDASKEKLWAGAGVYVSDFGELKVIPSRNIRSRSALLVNPKYASVAYYRPFQTSKLAKTGDSERTQVLAEYALVMKNEKAHGIIADLTTS